MEQIHGNSFEKKLSVLFGMRSEVSLLLFINFQSNITQSIFSNITSNEDTWNADLWIQFVVTYRILTACRVGVRAQVMVGQLKGHQHWQLFHLH
jgi:hypothetical protein